jgi:hypothetical protein
MTIKKRKATEQFLSLIFNRLYNIGMINAF